MHYYNNGVIKEELACNKRRTSNNIKQSKTPRGKIIKRNCEIN